MAEHQHPPLSYEDSATTTHPHFASSLPPEVVSCLKNSRFLHLATCDNLTPHVSLMSYTYLPSTPFTSHPTIIMTTNAASKKTLNLLSNPRVSLLVHDWVSHRPPTRSTTHHLARDGSPPPAATRSSLASLLLNINTSALSSISTTIIGEARFAETGSEEEKWCKARHLENNTFASDAPDGTSLFAAAREGRGEREGEGEGDDTGNVVGATVDESARVVIVEVRKGRIADWKGGVRDWAVVEEGDGGRGMVNGVRD
ncbi:pyridoxamine phosphate oxidase [Blastomyces gilchristii SLH14081]|uniref:Pyridoxamine phosphate oxidase n=1 Tax=Blastomyces gilchristii (strain SLH14081) TaxID=559298 RepID=A0A179US98_BLAGS|nr:pyridoxamine phosphate oxidase [Blastomyces gilchristii SLH14081]OAT10966.1 pyridoxamine phosphate oxidase [Blastomyces gilchristii SLH14081]